MKKIYILSTLLFSLGLFGQVGVNTESPKVTLDVSAKRISNVIDNSQLLGLQPPRLSLVELTNNSFVYGTDQTGAIIYITDISSGTATGQRINITEEGFYYFDGTVWKKLISIQSDTIDVSTTIDPNILGYVPSSDATASTAGVPTISGATITKLGTTTYNGNGHTYAAYIATNRVLTWYEAYYAAKSLGGYLATFTTDAEWQYVETNLITPRTEFNTYAGWIGFVKYSWFAGSALTPNPEMKWITGELPNHDYSAAGNSAVKKSNWFKSGEPNNSGGNEGFVHFYHKNSGNTVTYNGYASTHPWNDVISTSTVEMIRGFIVEFQQ